MMPFYTVPKDKIPFTITLFDAETGKTIWQTEVTGAGFLMIPGRTELNGGHPLGVRIVYADGEIAIGFPRTRT